MKSQFKDMELSSEIIRALTEMAFTTPTEVQSRSIPMVLERKDLIVMSKTGSGKTGAFGIPILEMVKRGNGIPKGLIVVPTRELAVQVASDLKKMAKYKKVRVAVVYGQHSMQREIEAFKKGVEVVVGTPGRLNDHIRQGNLRVNKIDFLVLDEADRMLDMGFIDQVESIIVKTPKERITMLFSATMPTSIQSLSRKYMKDAEVVSLESETLTVDTISQSYYRVEAVEKRKQLHRLLQYIEPESCIVFCNTRMNVEMVHAYLERKGYATKSLHGANSQSHRLRAIDQFKQERFQVLCATDVAARGLHINDLSLVVNFDVPQDKDSYVHRIGRTGRAGNGGRAITLVTKDELMSLYEIEEHVGVLIEEAEIPTDEEIKLKKTPVVETESPASVKKLSILEHVVNIFKRRNSKKD